MVRVAVALAAGVPLSDACTVKLDVPAAVGAPEITPLVAFKVRPLGKPPFVMAQE